VLGQPLVDQLRFYWDAHLWPRLAGLGDDEYFWEPVVACWSIRQGADGAWRVDWDPSHPDPPPFTTIAWRMAHIEQCFAIRTNAFFPHGQDIRDSGEPGPDMFDPSVRPSPPTNAAEGLTQLDHEYRRWRDAIANLDDEGVRAPLGPRGSYYAEDPMAALILHVNREVMHHGGEIGVMRDLYRHAIDLR
jgi:hypothetical protein